MKLNLLKRNEKNNYPVINNPSSLDKIFEFSREKISKDFNQGKKTNFEDLFNLIMDRDDFSISCDKEISTIKSWFIKLTELTHLKTYIKDILITEILFHGPCNLQYEKNRKLHSLSWDQLNLQDYQLSLEILTFNNNISWNYSNPFVSFYLELHNELFRATLIHHSLTPINESKLFLRRIAKKNFSLSEFEINQTDELFFKNAILNKANMIISGSTGSGKTSLLSTFISYIPKNEHLIFLEDGHEIITDNKSSSYLLSDEQKKGRTLKDYCAYALRMRPDRIILGEMRSHEVVPFILSMNTGHKGLLSTVHANNADDTIKRLTLLFSLYSNNHDLKQPIIMELICRNIDYIIHLKNRKLSEVIKLIGSEGNTPYFERIIQK